MCIFDKFFKKPEPEPEHKGLKILLKVFLILGTVASALVIAKILYDKYKATFCVDCETDDDDLDDLFEDETDEIETVEEAVEDAVDAAAEVVEDAAEAVQDAAEDIADAADAQ